MQQSICLTAGLILMAIGLKQSPSPKNFVVHRLAPGIWAAIQNDKGGHAISNAGIVDLGDKTLVFDAFMNPDAAMELNITAKQLTGHPVAFVVNSHYHDDHIRGNQVFVPGATIISTEWTRNEISKAEPEEQKWLKTHIKQQVENAREEFRRAKPAEKDEDLMWESYYEGIARSLPTLKTSLPGLAFKDSLWIHGSARSVLLIECSGGHTNSDIIMVVPKDGVAFMGDVLFVNRHPWLGEASPDSLKKHLQRFYSDTTLKQFVPGHGPVAGRESLQTLIQYVNDLQQLANDAAQKNEPDSVFLKTPVMSAYKDWWFSRFYTDNLQVVYDQAKKRK